MAALNATHDPGRRCWVASANAPGSDFPIQNLPLGVFRRRGTQEQPRGGVAIGDRVLDLAALHRASVLHGKAAEAIAAASESTLNRLMGLGAAHASALRGELSRLLALGGADEAERRRTLEPMLVPLAAAELCLPAAIGDYTDFYASVFHATNVGRLMRPDNPLLPNYKWIPIAYHGRASSVVASDTPVRRPSGQIKGQNDTIPRFSPSRFLDYEVEVGNLLRSDLYIAEEAFLTGTAAEVVPIASVDDRVLGDGRPGSMTRRIQEIFHGAVRGEIDRYKDWVEHVG